MARAFKLIAGHLALDLANTLDDRYHPAGPIELIDSYPAFLRFSVQADVLTRAQAGDLMRRADPASRRRALRAMRSVREAIEGIFSAVAARRRISEAALALLNRHLSGALRHRTIGRRKGTLGWTWNGLAREAAGPLWPVVFAAAELLGSDARHRVRQCECDTCRWLFLDTSKNQSRKWCDMKICGDRMKARAYYRRLTQPAALPSHRSTA